MTAPTIHTQSGSESAADVFVKLDIFRKYNKSDYSSVQMCFYSPFYTLTAVSVPVLCTWAACAAVPISDLLDRASQRSDMIHSLSTTLTHDLVSACAKVVVNWMYS